MTKSTTTGNKACSTCGQEISARRTKSGKFKGSVYYPKLCGDCFSKKKREIGVMVCSKRDYDKQRKHFTRECKFCGALFSVKGLSDSGRKVHCSRSCFSKDVALRNSSPKHVEQLHSAENRKKSGDKMFERECSAEKTKIGPTNSRSSSGVLISPSEVSYSYTNLVDFVRNNEHLFNKDDVVWVPVSKKSRRVSRSVGCLRCKASSGLHAVARGARGSWKGWVSQ